MSIVNVNMLDVTRACSSYATCFPFAELHR